MNLFFKIMEANQHKNRLGFYKLKDLKQPEMKINREFLLSHKLLKTILIHLITQLHKIMNFPPILFLLLVKNLKRKMILMIIRFNMILHTYMMTIIQHI